ncbi:DUF3179 domain-containing protein [soil metagenome]
MNPRAASRLTRPGLAVVATVVLAACAATAAGQGVETDAFTPPGGSGSSPPAAVPVTVPQVAPDAPDVTVSGLSIANGGSAEGAPTPLVDLDEIRSGGPPPDGIPAVDEPRFLPTGAVDFLADNEPVLAIDIDGDRRAYPVQILMWHEIVNDTVGGEPVAVTYCPLCNSAVAVGRQVDDRVLSFGTSGMLWNSALVMYDRQTETLWSHFTGQGIVGELTGVELDRFPVATVPWGVWRDANPDALVLSRETGFDRSYGQNPYPGYDNVNSEPFLFEGEVDGRFTAMTRIVGVSDDDHAVGVPLTELQAERVLSIELGEQTLVVFWTPGTASALDEREIAAGDDIGSTGVFVPVVEGDPVTFSAEDDAFVDAETGSTWNILGTAVDGPLAGTQLEAVEHVDTFWFAWAAFRPDTTVVSAT